MLRAPIAAGLITAFVAATAAPARAQPVDPYAPLDGADKPAPPPPAVGEKDPTISEAVAAALVARARELIAADQWQDAQQLLGEAVVESPDGAAGTEARALLDEVNRHLGITTGVVEDPYAGIGDPIDGHVDDPYDQQHDDEVPPLPADKPDGGKKFFWHTALMGGLVGAFIGDAATADVEPLDGNSETNGPIIGGFVIGALAGAGLGAAFRTNDWLTRPDVFAVDSWTGMGLLGSLSFTAMTKPVESEAYSVSAVFGTIGGAITGLVMAKRRDISVKRMTRIDLWAAAGGLGPWLLFAAASDGDKSAAQTWGLLSTGGLVLGAWIGFRTTRGMDDPRPSSIADAPAGIVQRDSDGTWRGGAISLRPTKVGDLGPSLGSGLAVDLVGVRF